MVLAKFASVEMVGSVRLHGCVPGPIFLLARLQQLSAVLATDARGEGEFADYPAARQVTMLAALLVIFGMAIASRSAAATTALIIAIGVSKAIEAFSDILYGLEADVVKSLLTRLSLSTSPEVWAEVALGACSHEREVRRTDSLAQMDRSPFNIRVSAGRLATFYETLSPSQHVTHGPLGSSLC